MDRRSFGELKRSKCLSFCAGAPDFAYGAVVGARFDPRHFKMPIRWRQLAFDGFVSEDFILGFLKLWSAGELLSSPFLELGKVFVNPLN